MSTDERPTWLTRLAPAVVRSAKGIIRRIVPGREDDVWQDVLIAISQEPDKLPSDERAFRSWIWVKARYSALNARRRRSDTLASDEDAVERLEGTADPSPSLSGFDTLAFHQLARLADRYIDELQPILRDVLLLSMSGISEREIAELLGGIHEDVVRRRLERARARLAAKLAEDGFDVPRHERNETEERMGAGISIEQQRALIYQQVWQGAEPQPDSTRVRYHNKPAEVVYEAARAAGFTNTSRSDAEKLVGKIPREWLELDWKGGGGRGCRMICKADPTTLVNGGSIKPNGGGKGPTPPPASEAATNITSPASAYRFLYQERGRKDGSLVYVQNPLRELSGKWPNRSAQGTLDAILERGWAEWREVTVAGVEGKVRRLYLIADINTVRNGDERVSATPDAPPEREVVLVVKRDEGDKPPTPPIAAHTDGAATEADAPIPAAPAPTASEPPPVVAAPPVVATPTPVAAAAPEPPPTAEAEPPPPPAPKTNGRRTHGLRGVYMTPFEARVWATFMKHTERQPRDGWNTALAQSVGLALVMNETKTQDREEPGEAIGRMCAAELLIPTAPDEWAIAWNPQDVYLEKLDEDRRMILTDAGRMDQIEKARELARKLANEQEVIDTKVFSNKASGPLGLAPGAIMTLLLDYYTAAEGKAGEALRVLLRYNPENLALCTTLLLAPDSLSGCDYFPAEAGRVRSAVVGENHPRYGHFRRDLRARYLAASKFDGTAPPPEEPAAAPERAAVEAAPAPTERVAPPSTPPPAAAEPVPAAPSPPPVEETVGEALARLEARRTELAEAERVARTKAEEFTRLAAERVAQADQFARERESVEADLTETRKAADELVRLDLDMAKILARKDELLAFLKKS